MSEVRIEPAEPADAAPLAAVYRSAYAENRRLGFPAKAEQATAEQVRTWIEDYRVFVARLSDGEPDGVVETDGAIERTVTDERSPNHERDAPGGLVGGVRVESTAEYAKLSRLGVHEAWKGEGIGSRLLTRAERAAAETHDTLRLTTPADHPSLREWYERRGYEVVAPYPLPYREYDELVFARSVERDTH